METVNQILESVQPKAEAANTTNVVSVDQAPTDTQQPDNASLDLAKRLDLLAKQEKRFLDEKRSLKAEQEAMKRQLEEQYKGFEKYKTLEEKLKQKDYSVLNEFGFDYDEYTKTLLNDGEPPVDVLLKKEVESLRSEIKEMFKQKDEEVKKSQAEAMENHQKALRSQWLTEVKELITTGEAPEKFPFVSTRPDGPEIVLNLIEQSWNNKKQKLTVEEAAEMANKYFFEEKKKEIGTHKDKLTSVFLESLGIEQNEFDTWVKSIKALKDKSKVQTPSAGTHTLRNDNSTLSASEPGKKLSREESLELASKMLLSKN